MEEGLVRALKTGKPVFVIGGASIYAAAWPYCDYFYLTRIEQYFTGDASFPESIPLDQWPLVDERCETHRELKSGEMVCCRFLKYAQPSPLRLPESLTVKA